MCTTDVSAAYGSVIAGASGFAQLVGVACSGTCYAEASRWSAVRRSAVTFWVTRIERSRPIEW